MYHFYIALSAGALCFIDLLGKITKNATVGTHHTMLLNLPIGYILHFLILTPCSRTQPYSPGNMLCDDALSSYLIFFNGILIGLLLWELGTQIRPL